MTGSSSRLGSLDAALPVLLKVAGGVGFVAAQVLWLGFHRPEPEFMAICLAVAGGGYFKEGLAVLRRPMPPPAPPVPPVSEPQLAPPGPVPSPKQDPEGGEGQLWVP